MNPIRATVKPSSASMRASASANSLRTNGATFLTTLTPCPTKTRPWSSVSHRPVRTSGPVSGPPCTAAEAGAGARSRHSAASSAREGGRHGKTGDTFKKTAYGASGCRRRLSSCEHIRMFATEGAASGRVAAPRYDVLVVSPGGAEAQRIATKLERRCPGVFSVTACTPVEAEARLVGTRPACIVLSLPDDHDPLLRLRELRGARPDTPVVIIGADDAGLATMLLHEGAQDHLPRSGLDGRVLARSLRAAIERSAGELALVHEVLH